MKDIAGLEVSTTSTKSMEIIDTLTQLFFGKNSGIDKLLPKAANTYIDCPMLQIHAAIMCFFSFSPRTIQDYFSIYLARINDSILNERESLYLVKVLI